MRISNLFILIASLVIFNQYSFSISGVSITLDRILLLLGLPFIVFSINWTKIHKTILFYTGLLIISTLLTISFGKSIQISSLTYYLPIYTYSLLLFFLVVVFITQYIDDDGILKILKVHFFVIVFFSGYTYYFLLFKDTYEFNYPLSNFLPDFANDPHKFEMLRTNRLWFPESSAPRLGFLSGFLGLFFFMCYINSNENRNQFLFYFIVASLVMFGTLSRSSMISFFLALLTYILYILLKRKSQVLKIKPVIRMVLFCFLILFLYSGLFNASRLMDLNLEDSSSLGHLGIRIEVLYNMIDSDFLTILIGHGIGSMSLLLDISSAHSSYFTVLFERGLFGLSIFLGLYLSIFRKSWHRKLIFNSFDNDLVLLSSFLFYSHWLYEASMVPMYWLYTGIVFGLVLRNQKSVQ